MNCLSGLRLCSLALACSLSLLAQDFPSEQQRLIAIAKLWATVEYFHPYVASKSIDWDKALLEALPAIRNAHNNAEFRAASQALLAPLQDPLTSVLDGDAPPANESSGAGARRTWIHHGLPSALPSASSFYQAFAVKFSPGVETALLPLSPALKAQIRLSEQVPASESVPNPLPDDEYASSPYPPVELRILAAFRIWGTIHNFFAYKDLMDEDWDVVFAEALPKFIAANDARSYHLAVAEMISHLSDSNSIVSSSELDRYFGEASPAIQVRLIEKKAVIVEISDTSGKGAGLHVGDVVASVDGEKISDRLKREANYLSVSTVQALSATVATRILNGDPGTSATLVVTGADDRSRTVTVPRSKSKATKAISSGPDPAVRLLNSNIGYVDLVRISPADVQSMFEKFHSAAAIIFDARGSIAPMVSEISSCLATHPDATTAIVTGPLSLEPDVPRLGLSTTTSSYFAMETVRGNCQHPYKGKTVLLIDERTIGNAEHLGLAMEAANNTEFLGTPSAGADSAVTQFTAPGGIVIRFSGTDVRHANAGPLQRMGLQPSLALAPKISAIRLGRDVVLEKAIEYLRPPATQARLEQQAQRLN